MTRKVTVVVIAVVVLLAGSVAGFYAVSGGNHQTVTGTSSCNASAPLQLVSSREETISEGPALNTPALALTWANCVDQSFQFSFNASTLVLTISANGTTSQVTGHLEVTYALSASGGNFSVSSHGSTTITAAIESLSGFSPGAQILHVGGSAWAIDSQTHDQISENDTIST